MIVCIITKNTGNFYVQSTDLKATLSILNEQIPIDCWWYNEAGHRYEEEIIFQDPDEQILAIRSESDISLTDAI